MWRLAEGPKFAIVPLEQSRKAVLCQPLESARLGYGGFAFQTCAAAAYPIPEEALELAANARIGGGMPLP